MPTELTFALCAHLCPLCSPVPICALAQACCAHVCPGSGLLCPPVPICVLFPSPRPHRCSPVPCPGAPVLTCAVTHACRVCPTLWRGLFQWAVAHTDGRSPACLSEALCLGPVASPGPQRPRSPSILSLLCSAARARWKHSSAQVPGRDLRRVPVLWPAALGRLGAILWTYGQTASSALTAHHGPTAFAPSCLHRRRKGRGGERWPDAPREPALLHVFPAVCCCDVLFYRGALGSLRVSPAPSSLCSYRLQASAGLLQPALWARDRLRSACV